MKLKRFIISFSLVLLAFVGTACGVVYSHYYNYSKELAESNVNNTSIEKPVESEESKLITSLITNITTADSVSGEVIVNGTGTSNLTGKIYYDATQNSSLYADIEGRYRGKKISCTAGYKDGKIYIQYGSAKFCASTTDLMGVVTELIGGSTSGDFSSLLDIELLQDLLGGMEITDLENGYKNISLNIPDFTSVNITVTANGFPTQIKTGLLNIGGENVGLTIILDQKAKTVPTIDTTSYQNLILDQDSNQLIYTILNLINKGGVGISGNLNVGGNDVAFVDAIITSDLKIKVEITSEIVNACIYYIDNCFYIDALGNLLKVSFSDVTTFFNSLFGATNSSSTLPTITMLNSTTLSVQDNTVSLCTSDNQLIDALITGKNYSLDLVAYSYNQNFTLDTASYTSISATSIINMAKRSVNFANSDNYSFEFSGSLSGFNANLNGYIGKNEYGALNSLCVIGDIENQRFALYLTDGYYYLNTGSECVKFSTSCINELSSYISKIYGVSGFTYNDIVKLVDQLQLNALIKSEYRLLVETAYGDVNVYVYSSSVKLSTNALKIGYLTAKGEITIYSNSNYYSHYISEFNRSAYTDLSEATNVANALSSSMKAGTTFSGNITLVLDKILGISINHTIVNISTTLTTRYSGGNLYLKLQLDNLPTASTITPYSSICYTNHSCTLTIFGNSIKIYRTITNKFSGQTQVEVNKTINLNSLNPITLISDVLGLKQSIVSKFTSSSTSNNISVNTDALFRSISFTDGTLGLNLTKAINGLNVSQFDTKIAYTSSGVNGIYVQVGFKKIISLRITLTKS